MYHKRDNLFWSMGEQAHNAYKQGGGSELLPEPKNGKEFPPKMASIASSSAMTFNLLLVIKRLADPHPQQWGRENNL